MPAIAPRTRKLKGMCGGGTCRVTWTRGHTEHEDRQTQKRTGAPERAPACSIKITLSEVAVRPERTRQIALA